jgi:hypothetical protein
MSEEATAPEESRYDKAFRETRRVLDECIEILMVKEKLESKSTRRNQLRQKRRELDGRRANLVRASIAFHAGTATMVPPSAELVAKIADLSREAVELTAERTTASAVLQLATSALKKFSEVQAI